MSKELYVVYFESANYAGYGEHCLVWAEDEDEARDEATSYAEDFYYQQDQDQLEEDYEDMETNSEPYASIEKVSKLSDNPDIIEYLKDPDQATFYPIVN